MRIEARAPARVDLAGGTVDIWPLYLLHPGAQTVNIALRRYASCVVETRADRRLVFVSHDQGVKETFASLDDLGRRPSRLPLVCELVRFFSPRCGVTIHTASEVPAGAGLAGSSALNIALCGALARLTRQPYPRARLLEIAKNLEAIVIRVPTGWQDYFPALYGGTNAVHLGPNGVRREKLALSPAGLEERFVLCYTGRPRNSGINNWEVMKAHLDGDRAVERNFRHITSIAARMRGALLAGDWKATERLLEREWRNRKCNFRGITTPKIDRLIAQTRRAGTRAAKVCGAGGGGCVLFLVAPGTKPAVEAALTRLRGQVIPFRVARSGLQVRVSNASRVRS